MAERGAQPGNTNATKNRPLTELIRRALVQNNSAKARKFADELVNRAIGGSDKAASEILDRIEGKVAQVIAGDPDSPLLVQINKIERK